MTDWIYEESCLTNLHFFEDVLGIMDKGEPVDVEYLDLQKAFDKILHKGLVCKIIAHVLGVGY